MKPEIVFENNYLMVLDKPSGWIVNEAATTKETPVVQTWLKKNFDYPVSQSKLYRSGIVHRLDKETSGVLLIAKTKASFRKLQKQFKVRKVKKVYLALVHGYLDESEGVINAPLGRLPWNRERFGVLPGGREAKTRYKAISKYKLAITNEAFSLLELYPKTGRTHQIRTHLKHLGHPIVSDQFYAGRKTARKDRKWCPRTFLHASSISFKYPETEKTRTFKSGLAKDLKDALGKLIRQKI